jgi:DNA-3-methyladenine glycosylase I
MSEVVPPPPTHRCFWVANAAPDYVAYHDHEWGRPVFEERRLFEKLALEGFQSGLSWLTILRKRDAFREVFVDFDVERVARFTEQDVLRLLRDARIVRHRGKIEATIHNAQRCLELLNEQGSLAAYLWRFEPDVATRPSVLSEAVLRSLSTSPASIALSKDLKRRGWKYVGPTTMYAFMQAMGLVNDHEDGCVVREEVAALRRAQPIA